MQQTLVEEYFAPFYKYYTKMIFSGAFANGIGDVKNTEYQAMFGINVIIDAINTIITENQLINSFELSYFDIGILLLFCLIASVIYGLINIRIGSYLFIFSLLAIMVVYLMVFIQFNFIFKLD